MFKNINIVYTIQVLLQDVWVFGILLAVEQPKFCLTFNETESVRNRFRTFYILFLEHVEILYLAVRDYVVVAITLVTEYLIVLLVYHSISLNNNFILYKIILL